MGRVEGWPRKCWWWKYVRGECGCCVWGGWRVTSISLPLICPSIISQAWSVLYGAFYLDAPFELKEGGGRPQPFDLSTIPLEIRGQASLLGFWLTASITALSLKLLISQNPLPQLLFALVHLAHTTMNGYAHTHACLVMPTQTNTLWWRQHLTAWAKAGIHSTTNPTHISPPTLVSLRFLKGKTSVEGWPKIW